jgi:hypothetical protein
MKFYPPKIFGEDVSKLVHGVDVACLHAPFFQTTPDEMVLDPDMLTPFMEDRVLSQRQSRLAIYLELDYLSLSTE